MKYLRLAAIAAFVLAGIALLVVPSHASTMIGVAPAPAHFTVTDAGAVGKPDIIMIPGLGSSKAVWDGESALLAPKYRLHIVQVDGFAGAPAGPKVAGNLLPTIVDEMHAYIVANKMHPVIIGHSLGGLLTLMLADKYPADVRKMVIVDTLPFYSVLFKPDATVASIQPMADMMRQQITALPADQFALMQDQVVPGMVKNADAQKLVKAADIAGDRGVFAEAMYEDLQTDLRSDVTNIQTPMLLLYPYDATAQGPDPAKVDSLYKSAYAAKPNVTLVRIDDSRHFIMYDQPAKMDAAIGPFLN